MKLSLGIFALSGAAMPWIAVGKLVPAIDLEAPAVPTANSTCSDWIAWMPPRTKPAVIMQAITEEYLPVEKNFIAQLEANSGFSRENIYLMCLDKESEKATTLMGMRCVPIVGQWSNSIHDVWRLRVKVLSCLLEADYSTILSDSDALWLKDPVHDFDLPEVRNSSIVASRGSFPRHFGNRWGSVLCMGFILFRASTGVHKVLAKMEKFVQKTGDDQRALNIAVDELGIKWDTSTDMRYILSTGFARGTLANLDGGSFNVTLLPHNKYTRRCKDVPIGSNTTVAHCFSPKDGSSKIAWMQRANLWIGGSL